ncbi:MAG: hypothetical protein N2C12_03015 [Planctomycetales bacterium]
MKQKETRVDQVNKPATDHRDPSNPIPKALLVWNNQSRLSLPRLLILWLFFLVVICLSSAFFIREFIPARWVLGGFALSHLIVFLIPVFTNFTMRRGFVSLMHLICWSPGFVMTIADIQGRHTNSFYQAWSYALIVVISISFVFDLRDACTYLYFLVRGKVPKDAGES